ncbi:MAG: hypothetical protein EPO51_07025 [Phenylobacterium sp.]|uniref:terminase small subunit-like protein n=1 Tax=Phenylobacterium sp. TaxID=1871053 RepID=UPI001209A9C0|nr:hypothetical protein [Phenylobacterium sp.]TAJ72881.1 MAG: hypothetical protein EPO51_07025 [Phenylobacterium sp.]
MPSLVERANLRDRQKLEILERVAAGETVKAACARPGMPCPKSVDRWGRQDPGFRAALDVAMAKGDYALRLAFDPVKAEAVLARLRAGESLRKIELDPAAPSRRTLRYWQSISGAFCAEVHRLRRMRRAAHGARVGERRRELSMWDARLADRVLYQVGRGVALTQLRAVNPALPSAYTVRKWRRERPDFDFDLRANLAMGRSARLQAKRRARMEPVCWAIVQGASLNDLAGRDGFPHRTTLYGWVARDPEIAREVARACEERVHWYADQMLEIAERTGPVDPVEAGRRIKRVEARLGRLWQRPGKRWRDG